MFLTHESINQNLGYFHILFIVIDAAINMEM